jgi:hypothetical protein
MRLQAVLLAAMVFATDRASIDAAALGNASKPSYASHLRSEARRLQAHFDSVAAELVRRDVQVLRPGQQAARAKLVDWLRGYRDAGVFPLNDGFAEQAVPIFRDRRGVLCAMAFLIARSGRQDIVDRIAHTNNLVLVSDLAQDSELVAWLDSVGLSLAEASRIQPTYQPPPGTVYKEDAVTATYAIASILISGTAIGTGILNIAKPTKTRAWMGLLAGAGATALGLGNLDGTSAATTRVAIANTVIGGAALVLGLRSLSKSSHRTSDLRDANRRSIAMSPTLLYVKGKPQPAIVLQIGF